MGTVRSAVRAWSVWLLTGAALALVLVASAARPLARGVSGRQAVVALLVVGLFAAVPLGLVRLWARRRVVAAVVAVLALLAVLAFVLPKPSMRPFQQTGRQGGTPAPTTAVQPRPPQPPTRHARQASHWTLPTWGVGLLVALLVGAVVGAAALMRRHEDDGAVEPEPAAPVEPEPELTAEQLYSLLDDTLDDLRAEPDARTAVVAAYSRMERGLAGFGLRRRPSEAPLEYLSRALARLSVSAPAAHRLTTLFERGKFSPAPVDEAMKREAIEALEAIKEEVGAWAGAR